VTILFELVGVGALILLNAFFVAAEYGLVTARRTRIVELQHQGNRRAREVLRITSDPPHFIAAMQLGVTLTSLAIGAIGEQALSKLFDEFLSDRGNVARGLALSNPNSQSPGFAGIHYPWDNLFRRPAEYILMLLHSHLQQSKSHSYSNNSTVNIDNRYVKTLGIELF